MVNVFIAYSRFDRCIIDNIVEGLELSVNNHVLWYYHKTINNISMDDIIQKIEFMDIFIVFLSEKSIHNDNVKREIDAAKKSNQIKDYITVIIDNNLKSESIPGFTNNNVIFNDSYFNTSEAINKILIKYK